MKPPRYASQQLVQDPQTSNTCMTVLRGVHGGHCGAPVCNYQFVPCPCTLMLLLSHLLCRGYRVWTREEEAQLHQAVSKHGVGMWADILADKDFPLLGCVRKTVVGQCLGHCVNARHPADAHAGCPRSTPRGSPRVAMAERLIPNKPLPHRSFSGVQLKDKWRNIIKFRHVTRLPGEVVGQTSNGTAAAPSQSASDQSQSPALPLGGVLSTPASPTEHGGAWRHKRRRNRSRSTEAVEDTRFGIYDQRRYVTRGELEQRRRHHEVSSEDMAPDAKRQMVAHMAADVALGAGSLAAIAAAPAPPRMAASSLAAPANVQPDVAHLAMLLQLLQPPPVQVPAPAPVVPASVSSVDPALGLLQLIFQQQGQPAVLAPAVPAGSVTSEQSLLERLLHASYASTG